MQLYTMLYIVLAYLMLFAALTYSVCLNNASFFFLFKYFLCQGYELSGEIALKNNHYYYYYYYYIVLAYLMLFAALTNSVCLNNASFLLFSLIYANAFYFHALSLFISFFLFASCTVLLTCLFFKIICSHRCCCCFFFFMFFLNIFYERAMSSPEK